VLREFSPAIDADVYRALTLEGSVASRDHPGGTAPAQVKAAIARARSMAARARSIATGPRSQVARARRR
jgi:argininosuccinate lyase